MTGQSNNLYTTDLIGSGQFGICAHCTRSPTKEGHDGCLGKLDETIVMNACCGHGDESFAYIQFWDRTRIAGKSALIKIKELKEE